MRGCFAGVTAAVLAGGFGTRLRSAVTDRPKVLASVGGRPWIAYLLDQLDGAGVREVVLLTGYRADEVRTMLGDRHNSMRIRYSLEPSPLGTAGALRHALGRLSSAQVLVMNGDSFIDVDLVAFWDFHRQRGTAVSMVLARVPDASRFGTVDVARDGRIVSFREKRTGGSGWINAGVYILDRARIEEIPLGRPVSLERETFPRWIGKGDIHGFRCEAPFLDIGTPESYARAEEFLATVPVRALS